MRISGIHVQGTDEWLLLKGKYNISHQQPIPAPLSQRRETDALNTGSLCCANMWLTVHTEACFCGPNIWNILQVLVCRNSSAWEPTVLSVCQPAFPAAPPTHTHIPSLNPCVLRKTEHSWHHQVKDVEQFVSCVSSLISVSVQKRDVWTAGAAAWNREQWGRGRRVREEGERLKLWQWQRHLLTGKIHLKVKKWYIYRGGGVERERESRCFVGHCVVVLCSGLTYTTHWTHIFIYNILYCILLTP